MGTVFDDLRQIQTRPGMYIGSNRVSDLFTFLTGYRMALWEEPGRRLHTQNGLPLGYFGYHLAQKYRRSASMGWANLLLGLTGSEEAGLAQFFVELEEFEALFLQRVQEPILTQEARRYNREEPDVPRCAQGPRFSNAKRLYRITLSDGHTLLAVEKETEGPKVWFESLFAQWDMKAELERCFGPLVWRDSLEDFLGEKRLEL